MGAILAVPIVIVVTLLITKTTDVIHKYKWATAYISSTSNRKFTKPRFDLYDTEALNDPVKIGLLPPEEEKILESPRDESHLAKASDEVLFYGVNSSSECFLARISRRSSERVEIGLYIKLKNGSSYQIDEVCCSQKTLKCSNRMFIGGGLKMYYVEPMRKWRLLYKGILRQISSSDAVPTKMVYIKFNLQWIATTDCFDTLSDIRCSEMAGALSRVKWNRFLPDIKRFQKAVDLYSQGGVIRGEIFIDGAHEVSEIYLFGGKIRYLGNASKTEGYKFSSILGHITKSGRIVHITELRIPQIVESFVYGYVVTPEGNIEVAKNLKKDQLLNDQKSIDMKFYTDELDFNLKINSSHDQPAYQFGVENEYFLSMKDADIELNSSSGRGILIKGHILKPQIVNISQSATKNIQKDIPLVVGFSDSLCQISDITGGKGSSLGKLTRLSQVEKNFIVPKGIVVTTVAYENFLTETILKEIKNLSGILYGNSPGDIKQACDRTMEIVTKADIPDMLHQTIIKNLQIEFGDGFYQKMFVIRSSTTGEDSDEMSAAGQMETYLGVSGLESIMLSVKKCWASQFSHRAVEYKRQNGQVLNSPMAVVIQEMAFCEVAGVLLTCDPVTGNPILMTISANYGLGESVVSGTEEPDTIILERSGNNDLKIKEKIIGAKEQRLVIKDGSLSSEKTSEADKLACSLSDSLSLCLGNIAIRIEKHYGCESDIEWGYLNNNFYIFQCRPVTTNNVETDYELEHENDAPMRVENEYFSVCNVGEVMPGATSPLGLEIMLKFFNCTFQKEMFTRWQGASPKYSPKGLISMYNHTMMIAAEMFGPMYGNESMVKSSMIAFFGRIIDDEGLLELVKERYQQKKKIKSITMIFLVFWNLYKFMGILKRTRKYYESNKLSFESYKTANDLYEALVRSCTYPVDALICHLICTNKSTLGNSFLFSLIEKAKGEIHSDVYNDISEVLSSISEVESADVPLTLENLAYYISKDFNTTDFQKMSTEDAGKLLMRSPLESGQRFRDFLKKHGHRCLREFDVRTPTWGENPGQLIKLLQNLTGNISKCSTEKKTKTFEEIASKLKIPLSFKARLILKYILLPMCRSGVRSREAAKSVLIMAMHEWRKGYRRLAKLMVSEGRIPDEDLLFFMSLLEIQELLRTRSPKIISRAALRKKVYPILDGFIFPEVTSGVPKPVNVDCSEGVNNNENFSMKGIPVSRGVTRGFLRVALTLEEASFLKPGEILLTYSTDIGWTPYFPILGGVATELGGLISHGAVVSREYGLPCIAGLHGATRQFRTGDYILMDANKGILQKLPLPQ